MLLSDSTSSSSYISSNRRLPFLLALSLLTAGLLLSIPLAFSPSSPSLTWSHDPSSSPSSTSDISIGSPPKREACKKTMLYLLSGPHGFASEYTILLRAAWFAQEHGYELLVDSDEGWVYGSMLEYLLPRPTTCVPDSEWRTRDRVTVGELSWNTTGSSHLFTSRYHGRDFIEDAFRFTLSPTHLTSFPPPPPPPTPETPHFPVLPAHLSLAPSYLKSYEALAPLAREYWRPSEVIEGQIGVLREGWRLEGRQSVGAHVRMGDKFWEQADDETRNGGVIEFKQGDLAAYLAAAIEMLALVPPALNPTSPPLKPLLVIMSDSPSVLASFLALPPTTPSHPFEIVQLPVSTVGVGIFGGHSEMDFGELSRKQRVQLTEGFVRDMTVMSREVGGFVGTGSSNVGDVISLLVGEERARDKGLARSLDSSFYWSSWFEVW